MPAGAEDPRIVFDELLNGWAGHSSVESFYQPAARRGKKFEANDIARITVVIGLVNHVYDTARAIALLVDSEQTNAAVPLVRSVYESALTAVWVVQSRDHDGITAFIHEYTRGRKALQDDALKSATRAFRETAGNIPNADPSLYEGSADSARQFRQICLDLNPGGVDAYILYRVLSGYSHATMNVVDLYFDERDDGTVVKLLEASEALEPAPLIMLTACSLAWAGRAFSYLSNDAAHRSVVRKAALKLGINPEPQLSENYYQRHAKTRSKRA